MNEVGLLDDEGDLPVVRGDAVELDLLVDMDGSSICLLDDDNSIPC